MQEVGFMRMCVGQQSLWSRSQKGGLAWGGKRFQRLMDLAYSGMARASLDSEKHLGPMGGDLYFLRGFGFLFVSVFVKAF